MINNLEKLKPLSAIHQQVWDKFIYVTDEKNYLKDEDWRSHCAEVLSGQKFEDDCDGFALTCADLLDHYGYPPSSVSIIYCLTEVFEGHLVCGCVVEGKTMILDNRYRKVYDWTTVPYTWKFFMKLDRPGVWLTVTNQK